MHGSKQLLCLCDLPPQIRSCDKAPGLQVTLTMRGPMTFTSDFTQLYISDNAFWDSHTDAFSLWPKANEALS